MFLDASGVLGIFLEEEERADLLQRIKDARTPLTTSPLAVLECVTGLSTRARISIDEASDIVSAFLAAFKVRNISITPEIGAGAIRAYATYGKRQGTRAKLNMGDCFAYACAKNYGLPLLYRGDDFSETDLRYAPDL